MEGGTHPTLEKMTLNAFQEATKLTHKSRPHSVGDPWAPLRRSQAVFENKERPKASDLHIRMWKNHAQLMVLDIQPKTI